MQIYTQKILQHTYGIRHTSSQFHNFFNNEVYVEIYTNFLPITYKLCVADEIKKDQMCPSLLIDGDWLNLNKTRKDGDGQKTEYF